MYCVFCRSPKQGMVIKNGKIGYLGDNAGAQAAAVSSGVRCRKIDLSGKTIIPGLHDVHMHPMEVGSPVAGTCKVPENTLPSDPAMWVDFSNGCYTQQKGTEWILGHGHSIWAMLEYTSNPDNPDPKTLLDNWVKDKPVIIMEQTSHSVWVNSEALKRAGLDGVNPQAPTGGKIMLNKENRANGILLENAGNWMMDKALDQNLYPELKALAVTGLTNGLMDLAKNGITSFVDARCYWQRGNHMAYESVEKSNKMTARAVLAMWAYPAATDDAKQIQDLIGLYSNPKNGMVRRTQIKAYQDGIIPTRTAKVLEDYKLDKPDYGIGNRYDYRTLGYFIVIS